MALGEMFAWDKIDIFCSKSTFSNNWPSMSKKQIKIDLLKISQKKTSFLLRKENWKTIFVTPSWTV